MRKIKYVLIALVSVISVLACSFAAYSYFSKSFTQKLADNTYDSDIEYLSVSTFDDFAVAVKTTNTESDSAAEKESDRVTIQLASDIQFLGDVLVTRDCNIDLGTYTIDLYGYNLTIVNSYYTDMYITNGTIVNTDTSKVSTYLVDLPNGTLREDSLTCTATDYLVKTMDNVDEQLVANTAVEYALYKLSQFDNITEDLYKSAAVTEIDDVEVAEVEGKSARYCQFHDTVSYNETSCIYTSSDLDLMDHYFGYDCSYVYLSGNTDILKNNGMILGTGTTTLAIKAVVGTKTSTTTVNVHIVGTKADKEKATISSLLYFLEPFYTEGLDESNNVAEGKYIINGAVLLPANDSYFGTALSYNLYDSSSVLVTDTSPYIESVSGSDEDGNAEIYAYLFKLTSKIAFIGIVCGETEQIIKVQGTSSSSIVDNNTIALSIMNETLTSKIEVHKSDTANAVNGYTTKTLPKASDYSSRFVTKFEYSLLNNEDNTYTVTSGDTQILQVNGASKRTADPNIVQNVILQVKVYFSSSSPYSPKGDSNPVTITVPVKYIAEESAEEQDGVSQFRPYYSYFNRQINSATNGYIYQTFNFPAQYGAGYPIYKLTPVIKDKDGNTVLGIIKYNNKSYMVLEDADGNKTVTIDGTSYTVTGTDTLTCTIDSTTYTVLTDAITFSYSCNGIAYDSLDALKSDTTNNPLSTGLVKGVITIDAAKIPEEDTIVELNYSYVFSENDENWITDGSFMSSFTLPGIVRYGTNERFADTTLYTIVYKSLYGTTSIPSGSYIITTDCSNAIDSLSISTSASVNNSITDLRGIELLTNCKKLYVAGSKVNTLSISTDNSVTSKVTTAGTSSGIFGVSTGADMTQDNFTAFEKNISYIAQMKGLVYLDLSGNNIRDYDSTANTGLYSGTHHDFIATLATLIKLTELHLENNLIYDFNSVSKLVSLDTLYVYNNCFAATFDINIANIINIGYIINNALTPMVNELYGSEGATNSNGFAIIASRSESSSTSKGVFIKNQNGTLTKFEQSASTDSLYANLSNLEYQNTLASGEDISILWANLSKSYSAYSDEKMSYSITKLDGNDSTKAAYASTYEKVKFEALDDDSQVVTSTDGLKNSTKFRITYTYEVYYSITVSNVIGSTTYKPDDDERILIDLYVDYEVVRY